LYNQQQIEYESLTSPKKKQQISKTQKYVYFQTTNNENTQKKYVFKFLHRLNQIYHYSHDENNGMFKFET